MKKNDLNKLILDVSSIYYNLIEIKNSINTNITNLDSESNQNIISEWNPHLLATINHIETYCNKINILNDVKKNVDIFNESKAEIINIIMTKAYWDKIEDDIINSNYEFVYNNLEELKLNLRSILPNSTKSISSYNHYLLDECFDIQFYKQQIKHNVFTKDNVIKFLNIIILFLKEWDSAEAKSIYDTEYNNILIQIQNENYSKTFRIVLEHSTNLVNNLILRKKVWNEILTTNSI